MKKQSLIRAVVLGDTSLSNHHGCQRVMENLELGLKANGVTILAFASGKNWSADEPLKQAIREADMLVINGEGSIHHNRPMGEEYLSAAEFAKQHGVGAYLINTTWFANDRTLAKRAEVFRKIFVRESMSQSELRKHGVSSTIVPDLTFARGLYAENKQRSGFLVTDSTLTRTSTRLYQIANSQRENRFAPLLSSQWSFRGQNVPEKLLKRRNWQRLVGKWLGPFGISPVRYQALACALPAPDDYLNLLSSSQAILSGRFHATCFAMITQTPFLVAKSNTPKIESMLADAQLSTERIIPIFEMSTAEINSQLHKSTFTNGESRNLTDYVSSAQQRIGQMFKEISEDASDQSGRAKLRQVPPVNLNVVHRAG